MQSFLPYSDFEKSTQCLDNKRLNKQITEALQLYLALKSPAYGWQNHPAKKMWQGYSNALVMYGLYCYLEWIRRFWRFDRGGKLEHKSGEKLLEIGKEMYEMYGGDVEMPSWLGNEAFHSSHRAALLAKNPEWYGQFGWSEESKIEYVWPVGERSG